MLIGNGTDNEKSTNQINLFCMNILNVSLQFTNIICCWFHIIDAILIFAPTYYLFPHRKSSSNFPWLFDRWKKIWSNESWMKNEEKKSAEKTIIKPNKIHMYGIEWQTTRVNLNERSSTRTFETIYLQIVCSILDYTLCVYKFFLLLVIYLFINEWFNIFHKILTGIHSHVWNRCEMILKLCGSACNLSSNSFYVRRKKLNHFFSIVQVNWKSDPWIITQ